MQETQHAVAEKRPAKMGTGSGPKPKRIISPLNGAELPNGRPKGVPNRLTRSLKEAVEIAARDCHPKGLAGWLIDRAQGGIQDRQIFAGLVGKVIPIQVQQSVEGGISINLNWLAGRQIGTKMAQAEVIDAQPVVSIEHSPPSHWTNNQKQEPQSVETSVSHADGEVLPSPSLPDSDAPAGR
jgi:hypothetical protein